MIHSLLLVLLHQAAGAPPPFDPTNLFTELGAWLIRILAGVAMLYFIIDLFKHVATSPRDLRAAGLDGLTFVLLLGAASKAELIVQWALKAL